MKKEEWRVQNGCSHPVGSGLRLLFFFLLPSALCLLARGQYTIDWSTIDGGGGASTGGVYSVSGTIGQPDAGAMSGGIYTLAGGFWGLVAVVQTPGAPVLTVTRAVTNSLTISWPLPADGWVLEQTPTLSGNPPPWTDISPPYQTNATECWIDVFPPTGNKFYRLHKP